VAPRSAGLGSDQLRASDLDVPPSAEHFPAVDLSAPPPAHAAKAAASGKVAPDRPKDADNDEADDDDDFPARGTSWPMALLASYASAVTLGLIWVLWGHRAARESQSVEPDPFRPAETAVDPGHRAWQSRKFIPPAPLPADRLLALGQTVRLGSLEVTPLEIASGSVILRREVRQHEARPGGDNALMLKLRLKNVSGDSILVPLDEAFLRARATGVRDSFVETGRTRQIEMFPLAVVSEWSIAGQEFRELNPDESYETLVVSAPDAVGRLDTEATMTWRVRLRVDVNQTQTLGIRFRAQDVRRMPQRERRDVREPGDRPEPGDDRPDSKADHERSQGRV
jgi:hypothetical protein